PRLGGTQRIGRRGDRGVGRVLIEPFLEVPDEGFEFGDPLVELSALGTRRYWGRRGVVHAAGQYGLLAVWQEQVSSRGNSGHPPVKTKSRATQAQRMPSRGLDGYEQSSRARTRGGSISR